MSVSVLRRCAVSGIVLGAVALVVTLLAAAPVAHSADEQGPVDSPDVGSLRAADAVTIYLPIVMRNYVRPEVRALWVSRFDWTTLGSTPTVASLTKVVSDAARAGFNTVFFQVRGAGDAYYTPGPEPWASRLTGTANASLGRDPGWDPLATMISLAHSSGISVHAYINVYPAWLAPPTLTYGLLTPTLGIIPPQWLNQLTFGPTNFGIYGLGYNWRVYDNVSHCMPIEFGEYTWASPAVTAVQDSILTVTAYLASHYALDGIHLDYVRYPGPEYSYDPLTMAAFSEAVKISPSLTITDWRGDFQRAQVSGLVARIYTQTTNANMLLSAAVWPRYAQGRDEYFQDSKAWMLSGTMDAIAPMLYGTDMITDVTAWTAAAQDFSANGRWVLPGIGVRPTSATCVSFDQIVSRIEAARMMGAAGQAIFSYAGLRDCKDGTGATFLDLLHSGPYAAPAPLPSVTWK
jgi:uncharacterized lipoprotein YddW (UPF0748 family)